MNRRRLLLTFLLFAACCGGGDDPGSGSGPDASSGGDDAGADAAAGVVGGAYSRVVPGYQTVAECRAENPDVLYACSELLSLCAGEDALLQFTDIVFGGTWTSEGDAVSVTFETWDGAFSSDGTTVFDVQEDGSLLSDEVYGERAFARSEDPIDSLCP